MNVNSCLFIMNNNLDDELYKSLFRLKFIKPLNIPQDKIKEIKIFGEEDYAKNIVIHLVYSGVGKSTYIKIRLKKIIYIFLLEEFLLKKIL